MIIVSCNCCLVFDIAGRFNTQVCRSLLNLKGEVKKKQGAYVDFFAIIFYFFCYIGFWSEFHASIQIQQKKLNKVPNIKLVVWFRGSSMLRFRFSKNNLSEVPDIRLVVSFGDCGCVLVRVGEWKLDI